MSCFPVFVSQKLKLELPLSCTLCNHSAQLVHTTIKKINWNKWKILCLIWLLIQLMRIIESSKEAAGGQKNQIVTEPNFFYCFQLLNVALTGNIRICLAVLSADNVQMIQVLVCFHRSLFISCSFLCWETHCWIEE